jgi:hypothetical protein
VIALIAAQRITILVAALAGLVSLDALADLTNIGTLFAFMLVSISEKSRRLVGRGLLWGSCGSARD